MIIELFVIISLSFLVGYLFYLCIVGNNFWLSTIPFTNKALWIAKRNIFIISILCLLIGLIEYRYKDKDNKIPVKGGADVFFLVDFTYSMLVNDEDGISRISSVLDNLYNSIDILNARRIGVSIFSDYEYRLIPFTNDKSFIKQSLISLQQNVFPGGGADIKMAFKELELREKNNPNMVVVILSDFENIGVDEKIISDFEKKFQVIAVGVGSSAGGKIPIPKKQSFEKQTFLSKNGKAIFSYFNNKNLKLFNYNLKISSQLAFQINEYIKKNLLENKNDENWLPEGVKPIGNYFVFIGLILLLFSRVLLFLNKNFFLLIYVVCFTGINDLIANDVINGDQIIEKIRQGNGDPFEFLSYANILAKEKDFVNSLNIYEEQVDYLKSFERINLGTLYLLNNNFVNGVKEYLTFLEANDEINENYEIVRNNLILLLIGNGSDGKSGKPGGDESNQDDNMGEGSGSNEQGKKFQPGKNSGLSNSDIIDKVESDDMVNQGEYIKKKTQSTKSQREIRW